MKYLDYDGLLYFWGKIKDKLNNKVDKVGGKGLSTNDYTTAEKDKLAGIASEANKTTVENVLTSTSTANALSAAQGKVLKDLIDTKGNGNGDMTKAVYDTDGDGVVDNSKALEGHAASYFAKATDITGFITMKQVEAKGYQTATQVNTAITGKGYQTASQVSSAINSAIAGVTQFDLQVVESLPAKGKKGVIYLMAHSHASGDAYDEYVWVESKSAFEKIGNTDIDLSAYMKKTDLTAIVNSEIDTIIAS